MWYKKTEYFPFGMREVRSLLIARGLFGFFGVFGMYCKSIPNFNDDMLVVLAVCIEIVCEYVARSTQQLSQVTT